MGKRRIIAETGAGQHGVASATACALLDLECIVYMGTEDMRRQKPNVERMGLLGARVEPVEAGARTLKEAVSAAIRDWVANVDDHPLHHRLVRGPGPVSGAGARPAAGDRRRDPRPDPAARGTPARAGGRLRGRRLELDRLLRPVRRRRRGRADRGRGRRRGDRDRAPRRAADRRRHARGAARRLLGDHAGRGRPDPPGPFDLGRPRLSGQRSRARLAARPGPGALRGHHRRPGARGVRPHVAPGGDHPGAGERPRDRLGAGQPGQRARRGVPVRAR